jgi:CRP-like cAMP-binding protein
MGPNEGGNPRETIELRQLGLCPEELETVACLPLFAGIHRDRLVRLLTGSIVRRYERNAVLFLEGEPATRFFVVLDGWVRLFRESEDGHHSTIAVFGRGDSFAEAAILGSGRYPVSGSVVTSARLVNVPATSFLRQLREDPEIALNMLAAMYGHLRRLVRQVEQLTHRSSVQRVADFLLQLCPHGERQAEIDLPLDKALIAARLGMQPETLSRSLSRLREAGVETSGSRVAVSDVPRLRQLAARGRG